MVYMISILAHLLKSLNNIVSRTLLNAPTFNSDRETYTVHFILNGEDLIPISGLQSKQ